MDLISVIFKDGASNGDILHGMYLSIRQPHLAHMRPNKSVVKGRSDERSWFKH